MIRKQQTLLVCLCLVWLTSCLPTRVPITVPSPPFTSTSQPTRAATPTQNQAELLPTPTEIPPSPTPAPLAVWVSPALPAGLLQQIVLPAGIVNGPLETADIRVQVSAEDIYSYWLYIAAAAFPALREEVAEDALQAAWLGEPASSQGMRLLLSPETASVLTAWWGLPASGGATILAAEDLLAAAWDDRDAVALLPFEALEPRWKVLAVDGQSPLRPGFDRQLYALAVPISVLVAPNVEPQFDFAALGIPGANFDPGLLTSVALTGVTALVRGTALTMEARGITYPAEAILPWLAGADILHINNEVPFYSQCPPPVLYPDEIKFCSPPAYASLLTYIGTDVVELAGDHFGDYGQEAMLETLALYNDLGIPYYGGGANRLEARQAVLLEHNGNQIAFIGCNAKGISYYAGAAENSPGAMPCDFDWLATEITRLKNAGNLVVATLQHNEYYTYEAQPDLVRDFQRLAEAGAVVVSGSQAHQPHGMAFYNGSFLHYGLGNLFFDQYRYFPGPELDRAFIDWHFFYAGQYIGTELRTIQFVDLARSRPANLEERQSFLKLIFAASGW